jgi:hypothetical protein
VPFSSFPSVYHVVIIAIAVDTDSLILLLGHRAAVTAANRPPRDENTVLQYLHKPPIVNQEIDVLSLNAENVDRTGVLYSTKN